MCCRRGAWWHGLLLCVAGVALCWKKLTCGVIRSFNFVWFCRVHRHTYLWKMCRKSNYAIALRQSHKRSVCTVLLFLSWQCSPTNFLPRQFVDLKRECVVSCDKKSFDRLWCEEQHPLQDAGTVVILLVLAGPSRFDFGVVIGYRPAPTFFSAWTNKRIKSRMAQWI